MTYEQVDKRCAKLMGIEYSWIPKWQKSVVVLFSPTRDDHDYMELVRWAKKDRQKWLAFYIDFVVKFRKENSLTDPGFIDVITDPPLGSRAIAEYWENKP